MLDYYDFLLPLAVFLLSLFASESVLVCLCVYVCVLQLFLVVVAVTSIKCNQKKIYKRHEWNISIICCTQIVLQHTHTHIHRESLLPHTMHTHTHTGVYMPLCTKTHLKVFMALFSRQANTAFRFAGSTLRSYLDVARPCLIIDYVADKLRQSEREDVAKWCSQAWTELNSFVPK